jgi:hypothetical protein
MNEIFYKIYDLPRYRHFIAAVAKIEGEAR